MTTFFVDTSAVVKRYTPEQGTVWVQGWILPRAGNVVIISELSSVEFFSALERKTREGALITRNTLLLQASFLRHAEREYLVVPIDTFIFQQARALVTRYPLRALDAIQLACAVHSAQILNEPITFVAGDKSLRNAALAEGFLTEDPNAYP